jgi:hypothetical protein
MSVIEVCGCHGLKACPTVWVGGPQILEITIESGKKCWVVQGDGMAHYTLGDAQARLKQLAYVPEPVIGGEG